MFDGNVRCDAFRGERNGKYPVRAVEVMARLPTAERDAFEMHIYKDIPYDMDEADTTNAICDATCTTARDMKAKVIIAVTKSGQTARRMSKIPSA